MDLTKILDLLGTMTVGQMIAKEGFSDRYDKGNPIFLHEFLYPLMQGYDSVAIESDVELGGTDQKFNIAVGRDLQRHFGMRPQFGLLMPILIGTDGSQKMSKSLGNYVGLNEDALTMYSKLEKTPDALLENYITLLTQLDYSQLSQNPRDQQKILALDVVSQYHGMAAAQQAQADAANLMGGSTEADSVPEFSVSTIEFPAKIFFVTSASGLCKTSSDARRQIQGGGVKLNGEKVADPNFIFETSSDLIGQVLQFGKNKFVRFVP